MRLVVNPLARRLTESELTTFLRDANVLIAGTEPITDQVISSAPQLGLIARDGIGLDNVDPVSYTHLTLPTILHV